MLTYGLNKGNGLAEVEAPEARPTERRETVDTTTVAHRPDPDHDKHPCGCYEGWVYLGYVVEDENGDHVEEIERVRCRRCANN